MSIEGLDLRGIEALCAAAEQAFARWPNVIDIDGPVTVIGDIHGDSDSMAHALGEAEHLPVFAGDIIDRGGDSAGCIISALRLALAGKAIILRGNHEFEAMAAHYGFSDELVLRLGASDGEAAFRAFARVFPLLPLAAVVQREFLIVHGGVPPGLTLAMLRAVDRRVASSGESPIIDDVLWSDPRAADGPSDRGIGVFFGADSLACFLERERLTCVIRGHEAVDGFEISLRMHGEPSCITVFSSAGYCGADNAGAVINIGPDGQLDAVPYRRVD